MALSKTLENGLSEKINRTVSLASLHVLVIIQNMKTPFLSSPRNIIILLAILFACLIGAIWLLFGQNRLGAPGKPTANFQETGYIENRTNQQENGFFLLYEKPGAPALSVTLIFDNNSVCDIDLTSSCMEAVAENRLPPGLRVRVTGTLENGAVRVLTITAITNQEQFGIIRSVTPNNQNVLVEVDSVQFLSGEKAIEAVMTDFDCPRDKVYECVPSMNNDFYIRNTDSRTETYILTEDTNIRLFANPGSPVLETVSLSYFVEKAKDKNSLIISASPFSIKRDGVTLTELTQAYTP